MAEKQKNRKPIVLALLLLFVVVTGALIGTLGKYVTADTVSDDAVVAEFGLNIPNTINLFSDTYTNVQADSDGKKIIAPGTSGQYKFAVTGKSEVAYKVSADIAVTYAGEWNGYAPLEFSMDGLSWTNDIEQFQTSLGNALESETMPPNTEYTSTQTIYWKWPFHVSAENDIKDTQLGVAAAEGTVPGVSVTIEMTATQID